MTALIEWALSIFVFVVVLGMSIGFCVFVALLVWHAWNDIHDQIRERRGPR